MGMYPLGTVAAFIKDPESYAIGPSDVLKSDRMEQIISEKKTCYVVCLASGTLAVKALVSMAAASVFGSLLFPVYALVAAGAYDFYRIFSFIEKYARGDLLIELESKESGSQEDSSVGSNHSSPLSSNSQEEDDVEIVDASMNTLSFSNVEQIGLERNISPVKEPQSRYPVLPPKSSQAIDNPRDTNSPTQVSHSKNALIYQLFEGTILLGPLYTSYFLDLKYNPDSRVD